MSKLDIAKFLMSAFNMVKRGDIKSEQDLIKFAKQEFGDLDSGILGQIKDVFTKGKAAAVTETRTKDIMRGDPTGEKKEGLVSLTNELKQNLKDLKDLDLEQSSLNDQLMDLMEGFKEDRFGRKIVDKKIDKSKPFRTPGMPYQKLREAKYRLPGGSSYAEGNLRTAMRMFLQTEVKEGRLKLDETDLFRITEYSPRSIDDPIDVFRRYYGEDALEAADKMASKLEKGTSFKNYEEIFRANMPELKIKTEGAGQYDQSIIDAESSMKQAIEDEKNLQKLEEFDIEGRTKNSKGGINRVGFARGKIKLAQFLAGKGLDLVTEIRKAVNNIMESGDRKIDADVAVDDMFDELGIDRDVVDQKDVLKAYDEAYKTLSIPPGSRGGPDDIAAPVQSAEDVATSIKRNKDKQKVRNEMKEKYGFTDEKLDEIENTPIDEEMADRLIAETDLPEGVDPRDTILPTGNIKRTFKGVEIKDPTFDDTMPYDSDAEKLAEIKMSNEAYDMEKARGTEPTGNLISKQLKVMRLSEDIEPGLFENLTDKQRDIIEKYGDLVDRDLLKNIVLDPDPNNQAAAIATLEQVKTMGDRGMSVDEIMNVLQSTPRRKQAEGGLSYLMGM